MPLFCTEGPALPNKLVFHSMIENGKEALIVLGGLNKAETYHGGDKVLFQITCSLGTVFLSY